MTVEGSDAEIAKAYLELAKGEKTASQLEKMLDKIEAKVDALVTSEELQELQRLQNELSSNLESTDDLLNDKHEANPSGNKPNEDKPSENN